MMDSIKLVGTLLYEYAESVGKAYPELKDCCREVFRDTLYSVYDESVLNDPGWMKQGGNFKGREVEVIMPEDLIMKIENQLNYSAKPEEK